MKTESPLVPKLRNWVSSQTKLETKMGHKMGRRSWKKLPVGLGS